MLWFNLFNWLISNYDRPNCFISWIMYFILLYQMCPFFKIVKSIGVCLKWILLFLLNKCLYFNLNKCYDLICGVTYFQLWPSHLFWFVNNVLYTTLSNVSFLKIFLKLWGFAWGRSCYFFHLKRFFTHWLVIVMLLLLPLSLLVLRIASIHPI